MDLHSHYSKSLQNYSKVLLLLHFFYKLAHIYYIPF